MEAESAMNSSEAVLANRFIRVFYHQDKPKVHQRLGGPLTGGIPPSLPANEDPNSPEVQKQKELQKAAVSCVLNKSLKIHPDERSLVFVLDKSNLIKGVLAHPNDFLQSKLTRQTGLLQRANNRGPILLFPASLTRPV